MEALILAAGYGTRMGELGERMPKALLEVGGRTILERTLDKVFETPVKRVYIVSNNKFYSRLEEWLDGRYQDRQIMLLNDRTNSNEERLGAIRDIQFAIREAGIEDDLMILCSDRVFDASLKGFYELFEEKQAPVNACCKAERESIKGRGACIEYDNDGRITWFEEKPENPRTSCASLAYYILPKETLPLIGEYLSGEGSKDAPGYFFGWLSKRTAAYRFLFGGRCLDIGNLETYERVKDSF